MPIYKMDGKRNGKQKYRVRINYIDNYGKAKQIDRVAYGNEEAKQLERELAYTLKEQKPVQKITVQALFDEYVLAKKTELRISTFESTCQIMNTHILPTLGTCKLDKLTPPTLQAWKNKVNEKEYKISSKRAFYKKFHAVLDFGVKMGYLPTNPLERVGTFQATLEPPKKMDFYTVDEFRMFIRAAKEYCQTAQPYEWNFYVFFCIAFYTGLRKGEIYALTWKDLQSDEISITKSLSQKLKGGDVITPPKNASSIRSISVPLPLKAVLINHKNNLTDNGVFKPDDFICGGSRPIRDSAVRSHNKLFAELSDIKQIRIHDFRHSHASLLINEGINIQEVARRLGHADISTTLKTYAHLYPSEKDRATKLLDKIEI